jgi:hypothetical protein
MIGHNAHGANGYGIIIYREISLLARFADLYLAPTMGFKTTLLADSA